MKNVVIFASGAGSNAENIMARFSGDPEVKIASLFSNNPRAGALEKANRHNVPTVVFSKDELLQGSLLGKLRSFNPDLIVLAGFLLKLPDAIVENFRGKIINIHPALLPKFGGKGMYGMNVHRAVAENKETETGITIHFVDEHYDNGDIILRKKVSVSPDDSCDDIALKVRELEQKHFPEAIAKILKTNN